MIEIWSDAQTLYIYPGSGRTLKIQYANKRNLAVGWGYLEGRIEEAEERGKPVKPEVVRFWKRAAGKTKVGR